MKAINQESRTAHRPADEALAPSPALEFVLALARHRAFLDYENAKLSGMRSMDTETIDSKSLE
jgi:hypothetical protein